tara:strand:+ start:257 stop:466 length:210 start_codon:yes stop_codon:yes gene_type:complete
MDAATGDHDASMETENSPNAKFLITKKQRLPIGQQAVFHFPDREGLPCCGGFGLGHWGHAKRYGDGQVN